MALSAGAAWNWDLCRGNPQFKLGMAGWFRVVVEYAESAARGLFVPLFIFQAIINHPSIKDKRFVFLPLGHSDADEASLQHFTETACVSIRRTGVITSRNEPSL